MYWPMRIIWTTRKNCISGMWRGWYLSIFQTFFIRVFGKTVDNVNVAVHEMSHALVYNNFFAQYGVDKHFRLNYEKFSSSTGAILADVITNRRSYLRSYAFSNLHEFWAVSVEAFFVNPAGLKLNMPELYEVLCRVLNQDPRYEKQNRLNPNQMIMLTIIYLVKRYKNNRKKLIPAFT
ncbi:MAG: zinc-dependent peptidase [Bacteroidota bacterium]